MGGRPETALFFFLFILVILWLEPIKFQDPTKREAYVEKIRNAKEKRRELEVERMHEKKRFKELEAEKLERSKEDLDRMRKKLLKG